MLKSPRRPCSNGRRWRWERIRRIRSGRRKRMARYFKPSASHEASRTYRRIPRPFARSSDQVKAGKKPATVKRYVATIARVRIAAGLLNPCSSEVVRLGIVNWNTVKVRCAGEWPLHQGWCCAGSRRARHRLSGDHASRRLEIDANAAALC